MLKRSVLLLLIVGSVWAQDCGFVEFGTSGSCTAGDETRMNFVMNATQPSEPLILVTPGADGNGDGEYDVYLSWNCEPTFVFFNYSLLGPYNAELFSVITGPESDLGNNTLHVNVIRRTNGTGSQCEGDVYAFNVAQSGEATCEVQIAETVSTSDPVCSVLPGDFVQDIPEASCGEFETSAYLANENTCVENGTISLNFTASERTHPYGSDYQPRLTVTLDEGQADGAWDIYAVDRDLITDPFDPLNPATYTLKTEGPFGNASDPLGTVEVIQPFAAFYDRTLRGTIHLVRRESINPAHTACRGTATLKISGGLCDEPLPDDPERFCFDTVPTAISTSCPVTTAPFNKIPGGPALEGEEASLEDAINEVFGLVSNVSVFNPFFEAEPIACQTTVFDYFCALTFQSCPSDTPPCQTWCTSVQNVCPVNYALNPQIFNCDALSNDACRPMSVCRSPNAYGPECIPCDCGPNGICDAGIAGSGTCDCNNGWEGADCRSEAPGFRLEPYNYVPLYVVSGLVGVSIGTVGAAVVIRKSRARNERELKDLIVNSGTFTAGDIEGLKPSQIKAKLAAAKNELQRQKLLALASGDKPPSMTKEERKELAAQPAAGQATPVAEPGMYESSQWGQ